MHNFNDFLIKHLDDRVAVLMPVFILLSELYFLSLLLLDSHSADMR